MSKLYYSIGEVCKILNIKSHVLRYWETEFSQLKTKRTKGNTRRYTPENLEILKKIQYFLYEKKYTIAGVKKILNNQKTNIDSSEKQMLRKKLSEIKAILDEMIN